MRPADFVLWGTAVATLAAMAFESLTPAPARVLGLPEELYHSLSYLPLTFLLLLAAVWSPIRGRGPFPRAAWIVAAAAVVFGVGMELAQAFAPPRQPDVLDAVANALGAAAALGAWALLRRTVGISEPRRSLSGRPFLGK